MSEKSVKQYAYFHIFFICETMIFFFFFGAAHKSGASNFLTSCLSCCWEDVHLPEGEPLIISAQ